MEALLQSNTPAFTRLPAELLIMILGQSHSNKSGTWCGDIFDHATLKSLRLACRQFAYLPCLLERLFYGIRLVASSEQVHVAETLDLSLIKPYVKAITMEPAKYSWNMTEEIFEDIILVTPLQQFCYDMNEKRLEMIRSGVDVDNEILGRDQFAKLGMKGFVQQYMDGKMPFSSAEISGGFERYMQHARCTQAMFETQRVQRAWTRVFTQLPDVGIFKIGKWDFVGRSESNWRDWGCDIQPHEHYHGKGHEEVVCERLQEPVGEALFSTAIAGLVAARSRVTQLDIEHVVDGNFTWARNGALDNLDLSNLQTLSFRPVVAETWQDHDSDPGHEAAVSNRCSVAITTLLRKCSTTLQKLSLFPGFSSYDMAWPLPETMASNDLLVLPALQSFITGVPLRLSPFAIFLHQCSALKYLQLDGCHGRDGDWRELWDAIRHHPNRMALELDQLPCVDCTEVSVSHHTGEASTEEFDDDPWMNIDYSLENYLSGRRHWDRTLRMWFENGTGESTDSESGGDEESDESDADEDTGSGSQIEDPE